MSVVFINVSRQIDMGDLNVFGQMRPFLAAHREHDLHIADEIETAMLAIPTTAEGFHEFSRAISRRSTYFLSNELSKYRITHVLGIQATGGKSQKNCKVLTRRGQVHVFGQ
jgi:hypothetical protein